MKNIIKLMAWISLLLLTSSSFAWKWIDLWKSADQQGSKLLQAGKAQEAAQIFKNKDWQAVAAYRSGNYSQAFQQFSGKKTSDGQYNAGNAAVNLGHYQDAITAYDKAIFLNPNNSDAIFNRDIIKKFMNEKKQSNNNLSANNTKNNATKAKTNTNPSSAQQNMGQNNSWQNNKSTQQTAQNNQQKDQREKANQQAQGNSTPQSETASSFSRLQPQEEDKKQLLRRLADDPGGLLQQKFLRDYFRRHAIGENNDQGETNAFQ